jgi:hydrogenase expression/formation protein HypC
MCLAVPGKLISIDESGQDEGELPADALLRRMGKVSFGGILKHVSLAYVPEAIVGDYVIVHVGFALSIVDSVEAQQTLEYLEHLQPTVVDRVRFSPSSK